MTKSHSSNNVTSRMTIYQQIEIPMPENHHKQCNVCGLKTCGAGMYVRKISDSTHQVWVCNRCISEEKKLFVKIAISQGILTRLQVAAAYSGQSCPRPCLENSAGGCAARQVHKIFSKGDHQMKKD